MTAAAVAMSRRRSDRLWMWSLAASGGLTAVTVDCLLRGWMTVSTVLYVLVTSVGAVGPVVGVVRHRPRARAAWLLLAGQEVAFVAGGLMTAGQGPAFPGPADLVFLLGVYPLLIAPLVIFVRCRTARRQPIALLDAGIITAGVALVAWLHLIGPLARAHHVSIPARLVGSAYPLLDLLVLAVALRLVLAPGRRPPAYHLLVGGLVAYLVTDAAYCAMRITDTYAGPYSVTDAGYMVAGALLGAAGMHPSMTELDQPPGATDTVATGRRMIWLSLASLIVPVELVIQAVRGSLTQDRTVVIAGACAMLLLLVLIRMATLE